MTPFGTKTLWLNGILTTSYIALWFLGIACKSFVTIFSLPICLSSRMHRASFRSQIMRSPSIVNLAKFRFSSKISGWCPAKQLKVLFGLSEIKHVGLVYSDLIPSSTIALSPFENSVTLLLPKEANELLIQQYMPFPCFL